MASPDDRYIKPLQTQTLSDGRIVYTSAIPVSPTVDTLTNPSIVASDQDRMDVLAHNVYGSILDWWRIATANSIVNGSLHIRPGLKIYFPSKT